jgi:hypothetical protein
MRRKISWKDGRTEGQTEGWKDGQTDRGKTVSPPPGSGGIKNYPDRFFVNYFLNSLRFGFDMLVSITDIPTYECRNALSARNNSGIVTRLLQEEIDKGFIRGPLGIATHKCSKKQRLILDLSSPHNNDEHQSVNDLIDKELCSLTYIKIDDAIKVIQEFGRGSLWISRMLLNSFLF